MRKHPESSIKRKVFMRKINGDAVSIGFVVGLLIAVAALAIGWVLNVVDLFGMAASDAPITAMLVLRAIGVFVPPLGGILGWL